MDMWVTVKGLSPAVPKGMLPNGYDPAGKVPEVGVVGVAALEACLEHEGSMVLSPAAVDMSKVH